MKNALVALSLLLLLAGCGSSSKKSDEASGAKSSSSDEVAAPAVADDGSPADLPALEGAASAQSPALDPKYKALGQAIRAGKSKLVTANAAALLGKNAYDPIALNALALLHLQKGHTGAAKLLLNKALEKNQSASLFNNLGVALQAEGDVNAALLSFKKAYKADPTNRAALGNLGSLYMKGGDSVRALPLLEASYKANPGNTNIANNYAIALRASGDLDGAARLYDSIIKADPKNVYALINEAILFIDFQNKPKDGLTLVYKLKFLETDKQNVVARANALEKKAKAALQ